MNHPKDFCEDFFHEKIKRNFFGEDGKYFRRAKIHWGEMKAGFEVAIQTASQQFQTQESVRITDWLDIFRETENLVGFPPSSFFILESEFIDNIHFSKLIMQKLNEGGIKVENHFMEVTSESVKFKTESPYKRALLPGVLSLW